MINGHTRGSFLDDKGTLGHFRMYEALRVPIYLRPSKPHPAVMQAYFDGYDELALGAWGFGIDTGTHFSDWCSRVCSTPFPNSPSFWAISARACRSCCIGSTTRPGSPPPVAA